MTVDCHWVVLVFSLSLTRSIRGGGSSGGKSIDNGLDDNGGEVLTHPLGCGSGDKRHVFEEGGVNGIHVGASGDKDEDVVNNGNGRFVERAK